MNKLLNDLKRLPRFSSSSLDRKNGSGYGSCSHFLIRWWRLPDGKSWKVEFAVRKHFDRWANSTNFACELQYHEPYRPDIKNGYNWMVKIVKSELFDWDRYFHTLDIQSCYTLNYEI